MTFTIQNPTGYEIKARPYYPTNWCNYERTEIVTPYLPMTPAQAEPIRQQRAQQLEEAKAKRFNQYQDLLKQAKKAKIPTDVIDDYYNRGQDLSGIKIRNRSLEITDSNQCKQEMFGGKKFDCVKTVRTITYPKEQHEVTLRNTNQIYKGTHTSSETISYYTTDEHGKTYKCHEVKFISIGNEPNLSEVNYYNSRGTKSSESRNVWQMK